MTHEERAKRFQDQECTNTHTSPLGGPCPECIKALTALLTSVAAEERERCAKVAEKYADDHDGTECGGGDADRKHIGDRSRAGWDIAAAIRKGE